MARDYHDVLNSLLNKAERTDNEPEREAILEKVAHLMAKHNIDEAMLTAQRRLSGEKSQDDEIVQIVISYEGQYAQALQHWTHTIGNVLNCGTLWHPDKRSRTRRTTYLYGYRQDVEQVQTLIDSLRLQMVRPLKAYQKEQLNRYYDTTVAAFIERRDFVKAFAEGAAEQIRKEKQAIMAGSSTGTELVLRDRKAEVQRYVDSRSSGKSRGGITSGYGDGAARGREAGRKADVSARSGGRKAIG